MSLQEPDRGKVQSDPGQSRIAEGLLQVVLQIAGVIVAPTTLVTALLYYFGWTSAKAEFSYFSVSLSMLGFTTTDYLLRSVAPMFFPLGFLLALVLVGLLGHSMLMRAVREADQRLRTWLPAMIAGAGIAALVQYSRRFLPEPRLLVGYGILFPPMYLAIGTALLGYAVYLRQRLSAKAGQAEDDATSAWTRLAIPVLTVVLIVFFIFWAVTLYADAYGRTRAIDVAVNLDQRTGVVVYSAKRLYIQDPAVVESALEGGDAAYRYRYEGLRLLAWTNQRYFILPDDWSSLDQTVVILPDNDSIRVELRGHTK